jgi:cytochrome c peroxidase
MVMKDSIKPLVAILFWALAVYLAYLAGPWKREEDASKMPPGMHDSMFHMHQPLHPDGKVTMQGQFHLELVAEEDGTHRLWLSNAFRQEINPAGFNGQLTVEPVEGDAQHASFEQVGRSFELVARTAPVKGQAWLTVSGKLGEVTGLEDVKFFWDYEIEALGLRPPLGLDPMVPRSPDNALTSDKINLGRELFFDGDMSADGTVSCATCHLPERAFTDTNTIAVGIGGHKGRRNVPTALNSAYLNSFSWDGRSESLERYVLGPILGDDEMGNSNEAEVVASLKAVYGTRMQQAFDAPLSLDTIAKALACYQRSLFSGDSDFDRYEAGLKDAISLPAQRGRALFFGKVACGRCHVPPLFSDLGFHNLGVGWSDSGESDSGRFQVTNDDNDRGAFKTPSLRDVSRTAPYMHDGSLATLHDVVQYYNQGGIENPHLDSRIKPLGLVESEVKDLVAFLKTLDGRFEAASKETVQDR